MAIDGVLNLLSRISGSGASYRAYNLVYCPVPKSLVHGGEAVRFDGSISHYIGQFLRRGDSCVDELLEQKGRSLIELRHFSTSLFDDFPIFGDGLANELWIEVGERDP
jgi:hypothetical protein